MSGKLGEEPANTDSRQESVADGAEPSRRDALGIALNAGVALSLGVSYGMFGGYAVTYLYPTQREQTAWVYVSQVAAIPSGGQVKFQSPSGAAISVARIAEGGEANSFIALSSTCPHMGCQVLWESAKKRFFCPCHNGVFNDRGEGIDGPPKGQSLAHYPVKVENGLLFIEVSTEALPTERKRLASSDCRGCRKKQPATLPTDSSEGQVAATGPLEDEHERA